MYKVKFNNENIATFEKEDEAIGFSLNLHKLSNIPHNIVVTKDGDWLLKLTTK